MGTISSNSTVVRDTYAQTVGSFNFKTLYHDEVQLSRTRTGVENRNYKQLIQDKKMATTALSASQSTCSYLNGYWKGVETSNGNVSSGTRFGYGFTSLPLPNVPPQSQADDAAAKCLSRYYQKVSELSKPLHGQEFLAELHQTIDMLRHPFKSGIDLLVSGLRLRNKSFTKATGNAWLQYRFGILPLMSDIQGILKIAKSVAQKADLRAYRVYGMSEASSSSVWTGGDVYGFDLVGTLTNHTKTERIIRFGYLYEALTRMEAVEQAVNESFLDFKDIPSTLWEVTPWSFLIDYFVNVGSIIESLTAGTSGVVWTSDSLVTTRVSNLSIHSYKPLVARYVFTDFKPCFCTRTIRSVTRSAAPPGIPPLVFSLPGSNIRLANIAALLTGLLFKR